MRDPDDIAFYARAFDDYTKVAKFAEEGRDVIIRCLTNTENNPHINLAIACPRRKIVKFWRETEVTHDAGYRALPRAIRVVHRTAR